MDKSNLLTLKQVASHAGVHPNTVRKLTRVLDVTHYCEDLATGDVVSAEEPKPARFRYLFPTSFVHAVVAHVHDSVSSQSEVPSDVPLAPPTQLDTVNSQATVEEITRLRVEVAKEQGRADRAEALLEQARRERAALEQDKDRLWEHVQRLLPPGPEEANNVNSQPEPASKRPWWKRLMGRS